MSYLSINSSSQLVEEAGGANTGHRMIAKRK